jgi:hypothetical protein
MNLQGGEERLRLASTAKFCLSVAACQLPLTPALSFFSFRGNTNVCVDCHGILHLYIFVDIFIDLIHFKFQLICI